MKKGRRAGGSRARNGGVHLYHGDGWGRSGAFRHHLRIFTFRNLRA